MIVDCHTHVWEYPGHLSERFVQEIPRAKSGELNINIKLEDHFAAMGPVDKAIVFAFKSTALGVNVPNDYVAEYVKSHSEKLIGFASVDPNDPDAIEELERAVSDLKLKGLKLGPIYQNFHINDPKAQPIYEKAQKLGLPIIIHQGTTFVTSAPLKYALPIQVEDIALKYPDLVMVIAHLGHPWEEDTIVLIRKQPNVYADISAIYYRPWRFYNDMVYCQEYGVTHKLLFGSDYPFTTPGESLEELYKVNQFIEGTNLPRVSDETITEIIERDALEILNLSGST